MHQLKIKQKAFWPYLIFILFALIYLLSMPAQFITGDSAAEVSLASSSNLELRPFHLLTTPVYKSILKLNRILEIEDKPFIVIQIFNILIGLGCSALLYQILSLLGVNISLSILITIIFAISNGIWIHTINAETGIHPQLFYMLSLYFAVRYMVDQKSKVRFFILALASLSISAIFALNLILLMPVLFLSLLISSKNKPDISIIKLFLISCLVFISSIFIPFLACAYSMGIRSLTQFMNWMLAHPESERLGHIHIIGMESILRSMAGLISAFIETGIGLTIVKLLIRREALYGITSFSFLQLGLGMLMLLLIAFFSIRGMLVKTNKAIIWLCFFGLFTIFIFNSFWLGSDPQFWLPGLPLILILMALGLRTSKTTFEQKTIYPSILVGMLILMFFVNIPREVPSSIFPEGGTKLKNAKRLAINFVSGDLIFTPGYNWVYYLRMVRKDIELIDLVYNEGVGHHKEFLRNIDRLIQDKLNSKQGIYFDGLEGPKLALQYGAWQMFQSCRGVSRDELYLFLVERYNLKVLIKSQEGIISEITSSVKTEDEP
jgi:hypothetical protein